MIHTSTITIKVSILPRQVLPLLTHEHKPSAGIGTYDINDESVNKSVFGEIKSYISQTIDQAIGTTFDSHVMAGYRFLMRYYDSVSPHAPPRYASLPNSNISQGDKIYMFGFSRGAFTAKFLARMVNTVGLLCKGQEEMVPFAYRLYQKYLAGEVEDFNVAHPKKSKKKKEHKKDIAPPPEAAPLPDGDMAPLHDGHEDGICEDPVYHGQRFEIARDEIAAFSDTFCRKEKVIHCGKMEEANIKVFFLGIWDCVNSVAVLERTAPVPQPVIGTATHVRHAVAIDERRVKFKAALLAQDKEDAEHNHEDIKEVWFPGCHGDVGGGWPASKDNPFDNGKEMTFWQRVKHFWRTRRDKGPGKALGADRLQLSDVPLAWMIREVELVGEQDPAAALKWRPNLHHFKEHFTNKKKHAMKGAIHDSLALGRGTGLFTVLLWKFMGKTSIPPTSSHMSFISVLIGLEQSGFQSSSAGSWSFTDGRTSASRSTRAVHATYQRMQSFTSLSSGASRTMTSIALGTTMAVESYPA